MNEDAAKTVCLVKAVETSAEMADAWSADDAAWASQGAAHIVGAEGERERYIECRANLARDRLYERRPELKRLTAKALSRPWLGWLLVLGGLLGGIAVDHIGPGKQINILAIPVLGLLLWNLSIYLLLVGRAVPRLLLRRPRRLSRMVALIAGVRRPAAGASQSVASNFWQEWTQASLPLAGARAGRFLHLAAAAFAAGIVASLYFRGIVNEYRAGWESTFLDAEQLHWLMNLVFGGISGLVALPVPTPAELESMRFPGSPGSDAAPWIHRIAILTLLVVILPRLVLALLAGWRQRWLERHFPLDLKAPYFQRLLGGFRNEAARVVAIPYSFSITPQMALQLQAAVQRLYGPKTALTVADAIAFGGEDEIPGGLLAEPASLRLVIFNLAATPEDENHGALLRKLGPGAADGVLVLVDETAFRQRFAGQAERLAERRKLWRGFLEAVPVRHAFCELGDAEALHGSLDAALAIAGEAP